MPIVPTVLTPLQARHLRGLAHHLEPIMRIGSDRVSEGVVGHIEELLEARELIKVRMLDAEKAEVAEARESIVAATGAAVVHTIGGTLVLYRRRRDKNKPAAVKLPKG